MLSHPREAILKYIITHVGNVVHVHVDRETAGDIL